MGTCIRNLTPSLQNPTSLSTITDRPYPTSQGGDNNLALSLSIFNPTVQCRGAFGHEWSSCRDILGDMPASGNRWVFGPRGLPGVQQGLPVSIDSCKCGESGIVPGHVDIFHVTVAIIGICLLCHPFLSQCGMLTSASWNGLADNKCIAKIFSTGKTDLSTWYRIWEAVTAVFSVCVRAGKGGVSTGIGQSPFSSSFRRYLVCAKRTKERRKGRIDVLTLASH